MVPSQVDETALIWASTYGYLEVVKVLVAARADVNAKDNVCVCVPGKVASYVTVALNCCT